MRRRDFIMLLGGAAVAWPLSARAQQLAVPIVGYLSSGAPAEFAPYVMAFNRGLNETGYVDGRNVLVEYRWAEGRNDRLPGLAAELVHRGVSVIAGLNGTPGVEAAKAATSTIPIVFAVGADPIKAGLVSSLSRPEGNVTGVTDFENLLVAKRVELLHELVPRAELIGMLVNPSNPNGDADVQGALAAVRALGLKLYVAKADSEGALNAAFALLAQARVGGLLVGPDPFFNIRREQIAALAVRQTIPASYPLRDYVKAGGLLSYGTDRAETFRQVGLYTGRILKGAKPADLPVMQPTKFELVINVRAARAITLEIPPALLARADEVIE